MKKGIRDFFKYARARHAIYLARQMGKPRKDWTKDPILSKFRFTNVFRELDKTTEWFRTYVREPLRAKPEVMLATVVFRLLNRIEVGEAVFCQLEHMGDSLGPMSAFDKFSGTGDVKYLKHAIVTALPKGPYVTGAYIISSPAGYKKLDGVLEVIRRFYVESKPLPPSMGYAADFGWQDIAEVLGVNSTWAHDRSCIVNLQQTWEWLSQFDYFGSFHAYEIVTDLRHTALLSSAPDIMTWANPGPGARRGANRVMGRDKSDKSARREQLIEEMREILAYSREFDLWPGRDLRGQSSYKKDDWPEWEMRDVEHTLCEFDKFSRVKNGEGRPRGVYR